MQTEIAIVGMACRYADARSPVELWENVLAQRRAFRRIPDERLNHQDYISDDPQAPDTTYVTDAAVIRDYEFDRVRYRIAGSTYRATDLTHWLALDVAAQALADAGYENGEGLPLTTTRVVVGNTLTGEFSRASLMRLRWPYVRRVVDATLAAEAWPAEQRTALLAKMEVAYKRPFAPVGAETLAGGLANTIAGRICNYFDLKGGGYTVDGACASSLLAVHAACTALAVGEVDMVLAGGVDLSLDPFELVGFAKNGALAPEKMRVFDARSAGFWPGEGCGFVVLMRHEEALAQGRRVYALIRGWGVSSDGTGGITRPETEGQYLALARAYEMAGFSAATVSYFEGHGTGTTVGDAVELQTILNARERAAEAALPAAVGSIKANIGHTKAAAGLAGLIKAAMAVHRQIVPPTTGCETRHPLLAQSTLQAPASGRPWPAGQPLRSGVSAMGFGGINTHVVLEGPAGSSPEELTEAERSALHSVQDAELFVLGADGPAALQQKVEQLLERVPSLSLSEMTDLAVHLGQSLSEQQMRAAVVARTPLELTVRLQAVLSWLQMGLKNWLDTQAGAFLGTPEAPPRIGYLFPGQASPVYLEESIWQRRFPFAASKLNLRPDVDAVSTAVAQPVIANASVVGLQALDHVGIEADFAVGHSLGELTALHWAGAMDGEALVRLATARGDAMARLGAATGAMMSIEADQRSAQWLLEGDAITIACFNAPRQTVIAGDASAIDAVARRAEAQRIKVTRLPVSHAFHSPLVAGAVKPLQHYLVQQSFAPLRRSIFSTITGSLLPSDVHIVDLLARQVIQPVRFTEAFAQMAQQVDLLLEVGPGQVLSNLVGKSSHLPAIALDANGASLTGYLRAVGAAYVLGAPVQIDRLFAGRLARPIHLERPPAFFASPCEAAPELDPALLASLPAPAPGDAAPATASQVAVDAESPLAVLRRLISAETELPAATIRDDDKLLSDLHLNSITVSQIVVEAARMLGLAPPTAPTNYADMSVATIAQALGELAGDGPEQKQAAPATPPERFPAGLDPWVHGFVMQQRELPLPAARLAPGAGHWTLIAPSDSALAPALQQQLSRYAGQGVVLCLPEATDESHIPLMLEAAHTALGEDTGYFVLVQHERRAGAFARSLHLEMGDVTTCVVTVPPGHPDAVAWVVDEVRAAHGFTAATYDRNGTRYESELAVQVLGNPHALPAVPWLSADDVLLVTGGGKGITAECVLALAQQTGASLALVGISRPQENAELAQNLARMQAHGVRARYYACDITQAEAVAELVRCVAADLGPVTGIVHGAARNVPRLLGGMDLEGMIEALAPKLYGLQHLLQALDGEALRLLVTFGSIIGRSGLYGEAHYGLANEWMAALVEEYRQEHAGCRCLNVEWSAWSGAGMAARLGQVERLTQTGITPISPEVGVPLFLQLLAEVQQLPASVVVAGRYGAIPTLAFARPELPFWRFLEKPRVYYGGVELVVDVNLSADTDLYLADHVVQGRMVFPGVMGLEAMAQAAMALLQTEERPSFANVEFRQAIVVPAGNSVTLRLVAQTRAAGQAEVVIRSSETGFQVDHFRAVCHFAAPSPPEPAALPPAAMSELPPVALDPGRDLYGSLMFQGERFQRVRAYRYLSALACLAEVGPEPAQSWYSNYLPPALALGSPGLRDALIHAIQVCTPHRVLLPVSVERIHFFGAAGAAHRLYAREREHGPDTYLYDFVAVDEDGHPVEQWQGLKLRSMSGAGFNGPWTAPLLGPYLERRLPAFIAPAEVSVAVCHQPALARQERSNLAISRALGEPVAVERRHDGKPELPARRETVSASHAGDVTLAVAGAVSVSCDLEVATERPLATWRDLLGQDHFPLLHVVNQKRAEAPAVSATRIWAAKECLKKVGAPAAAPLVLTTATEDGWVAFTSGHFAIVTVQVETVHHEQPLVLAVLVAQSA